MAQVLLAMFCSACSVEIAPKRKADGGMAFPFEMMHVARTLASIKCSKYATPPRPEPVPVEAKLNRKQRKELERARIQAENDAFIAAERAREAAELLAQTMALEIKHQQCDMSGEHEWGDIFDHDECCELVVNEELVA